MGVTTQNGSLRPRVGSLYIDRDRRCFRVTELSVGDREGREVRGHLEDSSHAPYACDLEAFARVWSTVGGDDEAEVAFEAHLTSAAEHLALSDGRSLKERDLEAALHQAMAAGPGSAVKQRAIALDGWEGRLGALDLAVLDASGEISVGVEVKWGGSAMWNCAWDTVKLAACRAEGAVSAGVLIAGASSDDWESRKPGTELFDQSRWALDGVLERFAQAFAFWRTDVMNYPARLPSEWTTLPLASAALELDGVPWELRAVSLHEVCGPCPRIRYVPRVDAAPPRHGLTVPPGPRTLAVAEQEVISKSAAVAGEGGSVHVVNRVGFVAQEGVLSDVDPDADSGGTWWFSSPAQRRAYAEERGWRLPGSALPDAFRIHAGSGLGSSFELLWEGTHLSLTRRPWTEDDKPAVHVQPDESEWRSFWRECDRLDTWAWDYEYRPLEGVLDGYGWGVEMSMRGRLCDSRGYMAFPGEHPPYRCSATWEGFLLALEDLVGVGLLT